MRRGACQMLMQALMRALIAAMVATIASVPALAQSDFPTRPIKLVVPYASGGVPDVLARTLGQRMTESMGQQVIVENRGGGAGIAAVVSVAKAPADGYTLLVADASQTAINPQLFKDLPYDTLRDLAPVSIAVTTVIFVAANTSVPITSFGDMVSYAKANPGKLSYGSAGVASVHHIAMEVIKASLGLDIVHVPYKGSGQSVPAFVAGDVQIVLSSLPALAPHVKSGKARLLAVNSGKRSVHAPEVPSVSDFIPGYDLVVETGVLAPAATPPAVVAKLAEEVQKAMKNPETIARLTPLGFDVVGSTSESFVTTIRTNLDRFANAIKLSGAKVN